MSSHDTMNPNGGVTMGHVIESANPNAHLLERILAFPNVRHAWNRVKANKGAAGIDGMSIEAFPEFARTDWKRIRQSLLAGTYQPVPGDPQANGGYPSSGDSNRT